MSCKALSELLLAMLQPKAPGRVSRPHTCLLAYPTQQCSAGCVSGSSCTQRTEAGLLDSKWPAICHQHPFAAPTARAQQQLRPLPLPLRIPPALLSRQ